VARRDAAQAEGDSLVPRKASIRIDTCRLSLFDNAVRMVSIYFSNEFAVHTNSVSSFPTYNDDKKTRLFADKIFFRNAS
jgi:hypothetical protein